MLMKLHCVRNFTVTIVVLLLLGLLLPATQAQSGNSVLGAVGTVWGGDHVELEVTAEGATLDFDCANGSITKPLQLDAQGNFKIAGTFTRERPGPVMRDGNLAAVATYSGSIQNGTMKLTISSGPQNESQGEYVLVQDKHGRVFKCR
jgi:hypothetical protein